MQELKYIIRLDDACPTMDYDKWSKIFDILDKYNVKPIIAVIPNNEDKNFIINKYDNNFWNKVKIWENKGYYISMHGYNHKYISNSGGLVPMNKQSEFAGVNIEIQRDKIRKGWNIFKQNGILPKIWVAPSHTFDKNTLQVLKEETNIKIISDGVAFYPYNKYGFFWIPQQLWWYKEEKNGVWTICLHPNNMNYKQIESLEKFIKNNEEKFKMDLNYLIKQYNNRKNSILDKLYYNFFFFRRKMANISFFYSIYKFIGR
jgi:predicted deacetylase